jgi:hypothetical protein
MTINTQKGSAIVWVFIAVGLFAALSFTFMQSNRTSTNLIDDEKTAAYANEIIAYGNEVKNAVKRLQLRGCDETEISFENDIWKQLNGNEIHPAGHNPNAPTDESCHVFSNNGGQIQARRFQNGIISPTGLPVTAWQPGSSLAWYGAFEDVGTSEADLSFEVNLIDETTCKKINDILGINHTSIPDDNCSPAECQLYNGVFPTGLGLAWADEDTAVKGKKSFCSHTPAGWGGLPNIYYYNNVLIAR